ncbi:MAG: AcvB/VirJ family lysyl-phosphatidylglycerol hydrolase [Gemmatimonadales bacterium]
MILSAVLVSLIAVSQVAPRQADSTTIAGLPVVEVPAAGSAASTFAVILSGDGGWAAGDRSMASALVGHGIGVVGLDVPSYLREKRTPDGVGADLTRLLSHYLGAWHKTRIILIGYSHGADIAPFMVSRLPPTLRSRIDLVALLGLEKSANFQFHLEDLVADVAHDDAVPVLPELEKLRGMPLLCVKGEGDTHSLCGALPPSLARVETRPGGHRISGRQGSAIVEMILGAVRPKKTH